MTDSYIQLKIGRATYEITATDRFMDNGKCIQLLSQSKECDRWARARTPKLSQRAVREINKFERIELDSADYRSTVSIFSLKLPNTNE
ncbi:hypothetical protein [Vibrio sp. Hal054]|uniref:hypothetical protein n=1 Tax=Vibrio sp. Hal054 TaxID=3035158 RepID=UPI00301E3643